MSGAARVFAVAALLVGTSVPSFGQDAELAKQAERARALLFCALFAAEGTEDLHELASPLARRGHADYAPFIDALKPMLADPETGGPLSEFIGELDREFLTGLYFAQVSKEVTAHLDGVAPFDSGGSYEAIRLNRQFEASSEFKRRNCGLL